MMAERQADDLARSVHHALLLDCWPSNAGIVDWGLDSPKHLGALRAALLAGATAIDLHDCCGDGVKIMGLIFFHFPDGRFEHIRFETSYDRIEAAS